MKRQKYPIYNEKKKLEKELKLLDTKAKSGFSKYEENHDPFDIRVERLPAIGRKDCRYNRRKTIISIKYVTKNGKSN